MSDDMDSRMKMLGFSPARRFFPYDEGREVGEVYLMMRRPARIRQVSVMTWISSIWARKGRRACSGWKDSVLRTGWRVSMTKS